MDLPKEGSSFFGLFQLRVIVFPVMASISGGPSGGSGTMSVYFETDNKKADFWIRKLAGCCHFSPEFIW